MRLTVSDRATGVLLISTVIAFALLLWPAATAGATEPDSTNKSNENIDTASPQGPVGCDSASGYLDFAVMDTLKLEGAYLIIVARLGTGEKSRRLKQHRLAMIEEYIKRRGDLNLKYVLAEGGRVRGLGRVELYVGGRLFRSMPLKKNKGYCDDYPSGH
jgi:hypothetical protein